MSRRLPIFLTSPEIDALLTVALSAVNDARTPVKQFCAWRDFCMAQTGLLAGPRVAELCSLEVSNVDLVVAELSIIRGKGDKDRCIPIGVKLLPVLRSWIGERKDGWLFPGPNGKQLSERTFQLRLAGLMTVAGIGQRKAHPHSLRHTFATVLLNRGVNLRIIQELLGHASVATTQIYTFVSTNEMKRAVDLL